MFRIYWKPFILSFSLTSKEKKDKVMLGRQAKAEKHDIKTVETYVYTTTHVVASKRNTALGLQGLVNGKYIVTEDFLDAVVKVAEAGDGEARCPLEEDFDAHWPKPLDYIPPAGNEPNPREPELFLPDERRQNLFEGCTIIFCEKLQYETFLGPITDGHGKLERFDLDPGKTTARELVNFVEKRSSGSGITTLVKLRPGKGNDPEWCAQLNSTVQEMYVLWFLICSASI